MEEVLKVLMITPIKTYIIILWKFYVAGFICCIPLFIIAKLYE